MHNFQYKILHNVLFLNKQLFLFNKTLSPLCSFCNTDDETVIHIFHSCSVSSSLWKQMQNEFLIIIKLPDLIPQCANFGFLNIDSEHYLVINHLLLIFKFYVDQERSCKKLNFLTLKNKISKIRNTEKNIAQRNVNNLAKYNKKWKAFDQVNLKKKYLLMCIP